MENKSYPFWRVSPQIFILGAGASRAAFPNGDQYGMKLPLMSDFIETVGLTKILRNHGITSLSNNIEEIYDAIYTDAPDSTILEEINDSIYTYFSLLQIPDEVTLYDKLLLSLQRKDAIFTFNWDPLLLQAYCRNVKIKELPSIHFLHGNVAIGVCTKDKIVGHKGNKCSKCGDRLGPSKLLFPIKDKDYKNDPFISGEWEYLEWYLNKAFILTIFGYGAPKTDVLAVKIMKDAWKLNNRFNLNEIEVVDILSRNKVEDNWEKFFHKGHYGISNKIIHTKSFVYARRSCEHWGDAMFDLAPWMERRIPRYRKLEKLQKWVEPLIQEELEFINDGKEIPRYLPKE